MKKGITLAIAVLTILTTCVTYAEDHGHKGCDHDHGPAKTEKTEEHKVLEGTTTKLAIKGIGIVVLVHNEKEGKVSLTIVDTKEAALKPAKAPRLNLMVDGKRKQVKTAACDKTKAGNVFLAADAALKGKLAGQIAVKIGDTQHKVVLAHIGCDHGHGHEGHNH